MEMARRQGEQGVLYHYLISPFHVSAPRPAARCAPAAGPRRAMRAVHLEAADGQGALPADLRHRVDGEEHLGV